MLWQCVSPLTLAISGTKSAFIGAGAEREGSMRLLAAAAAGALLLACAAHAKTTVAGWTIGHDNNGDCQATYNYKDARTMTPRTPS
jgi:hypothetical protein